MIWTVLIHLLALIGIVAALLVVIFVRDLGALQAGFDARKYDASETLRTIGLRAFHRWRRSVS